MLKNYSIRSLIMKCILECTFLANNTKYKHHCYVWMPHQLNLNDYKKCYIVYNNKQTFFYIIVIFPSAFSFNQIVCC